MGEKIKDLVYDFSDIIISLIIITMIFGVVSWKISDSMTYSSFTEKTDKATLTDKKEDQASTGENQAQGQSNDQNSGTAPNQTNTGQSDANAVAGGKPSATGTTNSSASNSTDSKPAATGTSQSGNTATAPVTTPPSEFKVDIPSGSSGIAIAKILKEKGIISDTKMFITRVDQLKMGPKLKAGSFTIKSGSSLDDVIYTLAGKKK